jgi:hypothetical protein
VLDGGGSWLEDDAMNGKRKARSRSVNALAFGDGPRKSYSSAKLNLEISRDVAPTILQPIEAGILLTCRCDLNLVS